MTLPKKAKEELALLDRYKLNDNLEQFDILHMYDTKRYGATHDGYYDSRFFDLVAYNTKTLEYKRFDSHDGLTLDTKFKSKIKIFVDGSTMFYLTGHNDFVGIFDLQCLQTYDI